MKKIILHLLCFAVFVSTSVFSVFAENDVLVQDFLRPNFDENHSFDGCVDIEVTELKTVPILRRELFSAASPKEDFLDYLKTNLKNHIKNIPIYEDGYRITVDEMNDALCDVCFGDYSVMVNTYIGGSATSSGYMYVFTPTYILGSLEDDKKAVALMDERIEHYLDLAENVPDLEGKLLVIHDAFCNENTYAYETVADKNANRVAFTAYGLFKNHRAVCQGNSIALQAIYKALSKRLEAQLGEDETIIDTAVCLSDAINHMWNNVKINGEWYFIDETRADNDVYRTDTGYVMTEDGWNDDTVNQFPIQSFVGHNNFLVPISKMTNHLASASDSFDKWLYYPQISISCTDDRYTSGRVYNEIAYCSTGYGTKYEINIAGYSRNFETGSLKFDGMLVTAPYIEGGSKRIGMYCGANTDGRIDIYFDRNGYSVRKAQCTLQNDEITALAIPNSEYKMFFWNRNSMKPLCETLKVE